MDYQACKNLAVMFFETAKRRGDRPFLWAKRDGVYRARSWSEARTAVSCLARGLAGHGIKPGDRVGLVSENRPEWLIADLAIVSLGAVTVPAYTTNTVEDHRHVLANAGVRAVIVSTTALAQRVLAAVNQIPDIATVVTMEPPPRAQVSHAEVIAWDDVLAGGAQRPDDVAERAQAIGRDDLACLIYTSGTGGVPKGVMLSHANILANCHGAYKLLEQLGLGEEVFLSFLPLSHSYEHTAGMYFPISIGAEIYYAEGAESLAANMIEAKPTIMTAVPRLYETLHQRILRGVERQPPMRQRLFHRTVELGRKRLDGARLTLGERVVDLALDRLVRSKVRQRFGGRLKAMVSGGAPLNAEIGTFFAALGLRLLQGYGQTEFSPVISANPPAKIKMHTVGPPLAGVEVRIAEDGEILARGEAMMKGYWNDPEATARTIQDGWLHTGDVGHFDEDGYIVITDRKRDFIKNSGGDMVSPARVEGYLTLQPEIAQAMVFGDRRPYLVAIIVPDADLMAEQARARGLPGASELVADAAFQKTIGEVVSRVNAGLAGPERVRRFMLTAEPFSVANGQMTPTLKIRRHVIRQAYGEALAQLYEGKGVAA